MLGFNRWHLFIGLAAIICIAGIASLALIYFIPAPPTKIAIGTGFKGGSYEFYGEKYKEILARSHIQLDVRRTEATGQNLKLLMDPGSGVQVAFVQGGVANSKQTPGHWEGDLLAGSKNSYIATLVERHTRYVMLAKVSN